MPGALGTGILRDNFLPSREPQLISAPDSPKLGAPALPTRFRFASGSARSSNTQGDLEEQLRERLRFIAVLFLACNVVIGAITGVRLGATVVASQSDLLLRIVLGAAAQSVLYAWAVWRLRLPAGNSLAFLRRVELGGVAVWMIGSFGLLYVDLPSIVAFLPNTPMSYGSYSAGVSSLASWHTP